MRLLTHKLLHQIELTPKEILADTIKALESTNMPIEECYKLAMLTMTGVEAML